MPTANETFTHLWDQTHPRLCGFICSRVANPQDAEDILQDVFFRVYHQLDTLRDPQRFESWLYQIARRRIIDHYRRRAWLEIPESLASEAAGEDDGLFELLPFLRETIGALPEPDQQALRLVDLQGRPQRDLADLLGLSLPGAKSRVQRARQKVKEQLLRCFDFELNTRGQVVDYSRRCCC